MTRQMEMSDFFSMEAREYLERLDSLVSNRSGVDGSELLKQARALRGSALMANQRRIAGVASAFEALASGIHAGRIQWSEATHQLAVRAVDDLKVLVSRIGEWGEAEDERAEKVSSELRSVTGTEPERERRSAAGSGGEGLDTGTRAFIAREGAAVASALDRAAREMSQGGVSRSSVESIGRVMQPLQGLASLNDVPPMPELLDGIARVSALAARTEEPRPEIVRALEAGARALSQAAREVAASGKADPDSDEASDFARAVGALTGTATDMPSIDRYFFEDEGPHIVSEGTPPAESVPLSEVELVAHGEYLRQAADQLESAATGTQRELRGQMIAARLLEFARATGGEVAEAFAEVARSGREALSRATHEKLPELLRQAAGTLSELTDENRSTVARGLSEIADRLSRTAEETVPAGEPAPRGASASEPPATEEAAVTDSDTSPTPTGPGPRPPQAATAARVPGGSDLGAGFALYEKYRQVYGAATGTLDELLAGPLPPPRDTRRLESDQAQAAEAVAAVSEPTPPTPPDTDGDLPDITEFVYSGQAALTRARELKPRVEAALATGSLSDETTQLISELLDLVELGGTSKA